MAIHKQFTLPVLAAFFLVVFYSTLIMAAPPTPNVNVVNTPDVNVVNTPDTNVVNTPDVNVVNTPDTNVVNTPDVNVVNTPDTNVVNTVDVNPINTIHFDDLRGVAFTSNLGVPSTVVVGLPSGRLHALDLGLSAPSAVGDYCTAEADLRLFEFGSLVSSQGVAAVVSRGGSAAIAHDYATPIEVGFDPTTTSASLTIEVEGQDSGSEGCLFSIGLVYEEDSELTSTSAVESLQEALSVSVSETASSR